MWLILAIVALIGWLLAWLAFKVTAGLIHLILVVAIIAFIVHFVTGRSRPTTP
jgi:hypothetical protein